MTKGHYCATVGIKVPLSEHIVVQQWEPRSLLEHTATENDLRSHISATIA